MAGNMNTIYFSAGPQDESNGLFGAITAVPEPSSVVLALIAGGILTAGWTFKRRGSNAPLSVSIDLIAEGQPVGHGASPSAGWLSFFGDRYLPGSAVR